MSPACERTHQHHLLELCLIQTLARGLLRKLGHPRVDLPNGNALSHSFLSATSWRQCRLRNGKLEGNVGELGARRSPRANATDCHHHAN